MTQTKKFSQFQGPNPIQPSDIVVGLRVDPLTGLLDNWQFTGVGSGGGAGGSTTRVIQQHGHGLIPGQWVRINNPSGLFVTALATTSELAEAVGTVLNDANFTPDQFTLQIGGFVETGTFSGLTPGGVYFLSDTTPGRMTLVEPTINNEVSKPLFIAYTDTVGIVVPQMRGIVIGGQPPLAGGGGGGTDTSTHTVTQPGHPFIVGNWVRVNGEGTYFYAQANTFNNSQAVGVVTAVTLNTFTVQQSGYNIGAVTVDDQGMPLVASTVYYLSATSQGNITSVVPGANAISKPLFVSETVAVHAGWILDQRPIAGTGGGQPGDLKDVLFQGTYTTTTNDWETVFCATITPTSANNRVWVQATVAAGAAGSGNPIYFRLIRNNIPIGVGDAAGSRLQATGGVGHHFDGNPTNCFMSFIDSPNTTTAVVYCVQIRSPSGATSYVNRTTTDTNNGLFGRSSSSISLLEVQPA